MKKYLAILLALALCISLGVTAFAQDDPPAQEEASNGNAQTTEGPTPDAYTVTKNYTLTGGTVTPAETLEYTVELVSGVEGGVSEDPTVGTNKDNKVTITSSTTTAIEFPINFPTYSKVGVYTYKITEKAGNIAGETYDSDPIYVVVSVINAVSGTGSTNTLNTIVAVHKGSETGTKDAQFTNEYGMGSLSVEKKVSGNLADNTKKFTIHVTFTIPTPNEGTAPTAGNAITYTVAGGAEQTKEFTNGGAEIDIELSNEQTAVFSNIPAGVEYKVEEDSKHAVGADHPETTEEGYTISYTNAEGTIEASATAIEATVTNTKKTDIDTGIILDSLPYILTVVFVLSAAALMLISKRRNSEV